MNTMKACSDDKLGSMWSLAGRFRSLVAYAAGPMLGILSAPILAHALGPTGRGEFAAYAQPLTAAAGMAALGTPSAVTYFVARGYDPWDVTRKAILLASPAALITYLILICYAPLVSERSGIPTSMLALIWLFAPITAVLQVARSRWQGDAAWARLDIERLLWPILRILALASLLAFGIGRSILYVIAQLGTVLAAALVLVPRFHQSGQSEVELVSFRKLSRFSVAAWPTTIFIYSGARLDQTLMPAASSLQQLGLYAVAVTVAEVPVLATTLIAREALQYRATGESVSSTFNRLWLYWVALIGMCVGLMILAPILIPLIFGNEFRASVPSTQLLLIGSFIGGIFLFSIACLEGGGHPKYGSLGPVVSVFVTIIGFKTTWGHVTSSDAAVINLLAQGLSATVALSLIIYTSLAVGQRRG